MSVMSMRVIDDVLNELESRFFDIPFENSAMQDRAFVVAAQHTPARAYRSIGLRMSAKIRAIQELEFARKKDEIDIAELEAKITNKKISKFDRQRAALEIEKIISGRSYADKLLNDAIQSLNVLYAELKKYPHYTREQFEAEERLHFETRLISQVANGGNGALESLQAMDVLPDFDALIDASKNGTLEQILGSRNQSLIAALEQQRGRIATPLPEQIAHEKGEQ